MKIVFNMSVLLSAVLVLAGCATYDPEEGSGKPRTGVFSQNEYAYAVDTPEQLANAQARFDSAVRCLESAGLSASSLHRSEKGSEAALSGKGTEVRLTLLCPDNGFAIITLSYSFKGTGPETKADAESLLASVHGLLDPAGTSAVSK